MCGGRGTRLGDGEKPLQPVAGEPMVDRVLDALAASEVETVLAVTSPATPRTAAHLEGRVPHVEGAGEGYVDDLAAALADERVDRPALTVVADLPLLGAVHVDRALAVHGDGPVTDALTVCVPTALKRVLGVSADATERHGGRELSPTGLNVVGAAGAVDGRPREDDHSERRHVSYDARLAVNVNRPGDVDVAEVLAGGP